MSDGFKSGNSSNSPVCSGSNQAQLFLAPSSGICSSQPSQDPLNRNPCSFFSHRDHHPHHLPPPLLYSRRWTEIIIHFKNLCMIEALKQHERFRVGRSVERSGIRLGRASERGAGRCCHQSSVQCVFRGAPSRHCPHDADVSQLG